MDCVVLARGHDPGSWHLATPVRQLVPIGFSSDAIFAASLEFYSFPSQILMTIHAWSRPEFSLRLTITPFARSLLLAIAALLAATQARAQGCVIARGGGAAGLLGSGGYLEPKDWLLSVNYRHFDSHRHFAGDDEQTIRSDQGTEVYNDSDFYDVIATYQWTKRVSVSLTMPFVNHDRSSMYEHLGNPSGQRFSTQSSGMGDIRGSIYYWAIDPAKHPRGNLSIGLGLKAPTGDYEAKDIFNRTTGPSLRYVDSSIQPGDGGWGGTVELQGFYHLGGNLSAYGNGFYLFNPDERVETTGFSIPDGYMVRGGVDYRIEAVKGLFVSVGLRNEGVVAHDLFGGSRGSRRPGFAVAVEPGATYSKGRYSGTLTVPIAVHRNRVTTYGATKAGDAAFADYTINLSVSMKL